MSQRITKDIAHSVAKQLAESKQKELHTITKELLEIADNIARKRVPKDILEIYSKQSKWFKTTSSIYLVGAGLNHQHLFLSKDYPFPDSKTIDINEDPETAKKIVDLLNKQSKKEEEWKKLRLEIEGVLYSLRTYSKIKEEFKEAYDLLPIPKTVSKELTVSIDSIRKKLK